MASERHLRPKICCNKEYLLQQRIRKGSNTMWTSINQALNIIDNFVWGVPLMVLIIAGGLLLTIRLGLLQIRKLPLALKWMLQNEEGGKGEISSFSALCTALSATIRYRKYRRCRYSGLCRRSRCSVLDGCSSVSRHGNQILRRSAGSQIPYRC